MRIGDVDFNKKLVKPELSLCKPNREIIDIISDAYDIEFDLQLGTINELNFKVPIFIDKNHVIERNETVEVIKGRYNIYLELGNHKEYFVINQLRKSGSDREEYLEIQCLALGYELNDNIVREYEVISYTCSQILNDLLKDTIWTIGYIDSDFDLQYRSFEISSNTVLEGVTELAKTFNAVIQYDTINRKISFLKPQNTGLYKGFTISYGKYLESINQEENSEEIITRLRMYGKEGISIQSIVPTGTTYVEDLSYFKYPYEEAFIKYNNNIPTESWNKNSFYSNYSGSGDNINVTSSSTVSLAVDNSIYNNFTFKGKFKATQNTVNSGLGFIFGYSSSNNYYYFEYVRTPNELDIALRLYHYNSGVSTLIASSEIVKRWSTAITHLFELEVLNRIVSLKIDNVIALSYELPAYVGGGVGVLSKGNTINFTNLNMEIINYNVIKQSDYMTNELAYYENRYQELLINSQNEFNLLVQYRNNYNEQLSILDDELQVLTTEYKKLLDERDILNTRIARNQDSIDRADNNEEPKDFLESTRDGLVAQRDAKLIEIQNKLNELNAKESEIAVVQTQFDGLMHEIDLYRTKISIQNNFPARTLAERKTYEIEKDWTETNIDNAERLYEEGLKVFEEYRKEKITVSVDIVNFLSMITEQINWDKLNIGDEFDIEHERLNLKYRAKVTEIKYNFENNSIDITISNIQDLYSNKNKWLDMLYKNNKISSSVQIKEWEWDLSLENKGSINEIINNMWDANKQAILGAKDQVIEISDRGLIIRDENDPNVYLVGINGMIAITNDGGNTFKHAITSEGIVGERIYGKVIMGVNLAIEDESGILIIQGSRGRIYNREGVLRMHFGLVEEDGLCGEAFGLIAQNEITQVKVTDCEGFVINRYNPNEQDYDDGWEKVFWTTTDGTIFGHDLVVSNIKVVSDKEWDALIMDSELGFFDIGWFSKIVKDGKLTTDEKLNLITELRKISSSYMEILKQAEKYTYVSRDDYINFNSAFDGTDFQRIKSTEAKLSTQPITDAYLRLVDFMSNYIMITSAHPHKPVIIQTENEMTETTSDLGSNRETLIIRYKDFYDEYDKLRHLIEDIIVYQGISMGDNYNNVYIGEHGLVVVRNDKIYRAYLNATNGLALQKWENGVWVSKLFATLGDPDWEDGTLVAEGLVTKNLRIVDAHMNDRITFDWYDGITIYGDSNTVYLNANDSIKITDLAGDEKFWVDMNGFLYAKDITTHNLKIVNGELGEKITFDHEDGITIYGNNGEIIYLNANDAIRIEVEGESKFWVGTDGNLYARKLFIMNGELDEEILDNLDTDDSFISDLTVTRLRTLDVNDPYNYVHIKQKSLKFMTRYDVNDSSTEKAKYEMYFEGSGTNAYPVAVWGAGSTDNPNENKAKQYKNEFGLYTEYVDLYGEKHEINMTTDRTKSINLKTPRTFLLEAGGGKIEINNAKFEMKFGSQSFYMDANGVKINGTRIDLN